MYYIITLYYLSIFIMEKKMIIPRKVFLTQGNGEGHLAIESFELALRMAGVEHQNLVPVSSILPPICTIIPKEE